jgi:hypothetical protein
VRFVDSQRMTFSTRSTTWTSSTRTT